MNFFDASSLVFRAMRRPWRHAPKIFRGQRGKHGIRRLMRQADHGALLVDAASMLHLLKLLVNTILKRNKRVGQQFDLIRQIGRFRNFFELSHSAHDGGVQDYIIR